MFTSAPKEAKPTRYPAFDWIRLGLALGVAGIHTQNAVWIHSKAGWHYQGMTPFVPGFLAISGLCVLQSYVYSRNWFHFIWKRICRIFPALLVSFLLVALLWSFTDLKVVVQYYLTGSAIPVHGAENVNHPLWSLTWEEIYYAAMAATYLLGGYSRPPVIWALFIASSVSAGLTLFLLPTEFTHNVAPLAPAFFLGNLAYIYRRQIETWNLRWVTTGFIFITGLCFIRAPIWMQFWQQMAWIAFLVPLGMLLQSVRGVRWDVSYGVYIYHMIAINAILDYGLIRSGLAVTALCLTIVFSFLSCIAIERPALRFKDIRFPSSRFAFGKPAA
jgi:peptidoglycan/LPS O-acetylase OafA/YrhL